MYSHLDVIRTVAQRFLDGQSSVNDRDFKLKNTAD